MPSKIDKIQLSLESQIKKVIGNRILACASFIMIIVIGLTAYDVSESIKDMQSHVNERIKPLEDFIIGQMIIDNPSAVKVKLDSFNKSNHEFDVKWKPENIYSFHKISWKFPYIRWTYNYKLGDIAGYQFGYFKVSGSIFSSKEMYYDLLIRVGLLFVFMISVLIFLLPLAKKIPQKLFVDPTNRFIDLFCKSENREEIALEPLPKELEELEIKIKELLDREKEHERNKSAIAMGEMSSQVAHDIRSPLAALNAIVKQTIDIPENARIMIRNATQQINDIANNLLVQYRTVSIASDLKKSISPEIVSLLLDTVISEKRAQYNNLPVEIDLNVDSDSHGIFANLNGVDFKRVISNLIDNAVEAIKTKGKINLYLTHTPKTIQIDISDNGSGMSQDLINKIMDGNAVSSKKVGHGIGLASALKSIQSWGGELKIVSRLQQGTTIHITLPLMIPAHWFAPILKFKENSTVVILDDDKSIHDVWDSRIKSEVPPANLYLLNFYNSNDLLNYDLTLLKSKPAQYLCDYELLGCELTGLDVIEKLNIASCSTLVTSRYEDECIRERCAKLGVKILPKSYTIHIPIEIDIMTKNIEYADTEMVFIDDNKALTDAWSFRAECINKKLEIFNTVSNFMEAIDKYSKETIFYIDSELDNGQKGEHLAKILYDKGYQNLYLATGHPKDHFGDLPFLRDILGKNPPF